MFVQQQNLSPTQEIYKKISKFIPEAEWKIHAPLIEKINNEFCKNESQRKIFELIYKPDIFISGDELLFDKSINFRPTYVGESITEGNIIKLEDFKNEILLANNKKCKILENVK